MVASRFLEKSGFRGNFTIEGSLTGGLSVRDLRLESDKTVGRITVDQVMPVYKMGKLLKGNIDGLEINGMHLDVRLDRLKPDEKKAPLDLEKLSQTLRDFRSKALPVAVDLKDVSVSATRDGKTVFVLAPSRLHHKPGDSTVMLALGEITDANGRVWPSRDSTIVWNEEDLSIERVDPLPGVSVRGFVLRYPASGGPSAEAEIHADDAVFVMNAAPGFSSARIDLREGRVESERIAERFALKLPAKGSLTSFSLNVAGFLTDPKSATGDVRMLFENVVSGDWRVPELSLDAELETDRSTMAARGVMLGTEFSINAAAPVSRAGGKMQLGDARGHFNVAELSKLIAALAERTQAIDPAAPAPPSMLDGDFHVVFAGNRPDSADAEAILKPLDPTTAAPISAKGSWQSGQPASIVLETEGLKANADYHPESTIYQATLELDGFNSTRIDRWLAIVKAKAGGAVSLTGKWQGGGDLKNGRHHGSLSLVRGELVREGVPPMAADGTIDYNWPGGFLTKNLRFQTQEQIISAEAKLADGLLELSNLKWMDHGTEIAGGSARLPVPDDFTQWREVLAKDVRPLDVSFESQVLPLALLKDWLPIAAKLDSRSTGRVRIMVSGSYAEPSIDAVFEVKDLRSPQQPNLPPADLKLTLAGRDGHLSLDGTATAPDFPAAVMTASMPFRPAEWAENPGLIKTEQLTARVDLPRIDLSRFSSLVLPARKISGFVTGNIEVAGEIGKPVIKGKLDLTGGGIELKDHRHPDISGVGTSVDFDLDRVTMKDLKATIAGGTLRGGGSLVIESGKPVALDFRVTGKQLPLKRDDSMIVRANADLRLSGNWELAALTGTVGVVDSLFYRDIELLPIGRPFTTPSAAALPKIDVPAQPSVAVPERFRNWTINVLARTEEPVLIRGNFATGRIDGNVRIGGTFGSPTPDGEVRISDFRAALPFSTLKVRSGILRYSPATGFDPYVEIRGTAEPRPYQVNVFVYGRASDPQLVLTSNPPLPENEIMTLLATGTTTTGLENPQAASTRTLQLLAEELRRGRFGVGRQLRPILGLLDRVDFTLAESDPYSSDSFSTATLAITDRWYLSAGMGQEGDSRVLVIWRLTFH